MPCDMNMMIHKFTSGKWNKNISYLGVEWLVFHLQMPFKEHVLSSALEIIIIPIIYLQL